MRRRSRGRWNLEGLDAALEALVRRSLPDGSDEVILVETGDGVQRMTARDMLDSFERALEGFEVLKVCVG